MSFLCHNCKQAWEQAQAQINDDHHENQLRNSNAAEILIDDVVFNYPVSKITYFFVLQIPSFPHIISHVKF